MDHRDGCDSYKDDASTDIVYITPEIFPDFKPKEGPGK